MRLQRYKKNTHIRKKTSTFFEILTTYHLVFKTHVRAWANFYFSLLGCEVVCSLYGYYFFFLSLLFYHFTGLSCNPQPVMVAIYGIYAYANFWCPK